MRSSSPAGLGSVSVKVGQYEPAWLDAGWLSSQGQPLSSYSSQLVDLFKAYFEPADMAETNNVGTTSAR